MYQYIFKHPFPCMHIYYFSGNLFTGEIPPAISTTKIEQLILSHNYFTGVLPVQLQNLTCLKTILAQRNFLTGQPDNIFNLTGQILLTAVDFSFNDFTGPIPTRVFQLPILRTFAAEKTCFHGSLPLQICDASSLRVLLLDGVTSGLACQQRIDFFGSRDSNAYFSTNGPLTGVYWYILYARLRLRSQSLSQSLSLSFLPLLRVIILCSVTEIILVVRATFCTCCNTLTIN